MISMKTIYGIGAGLMLVSLAANLYMLIEGWINMSIASRISFIFGSILLQALIMISFAVMFKMTPSMPIVNQQVNDPETQKYLQELSNSYKEVKQ